jgi:hypothetical protein
VISERSDAGRIDILEAYAENYLTQEIRQEALVKNPAAFTRFVDVVATINGQVSNVAGIARDAAVARPTVQGYFEILVDTLIAVWLPAWRPAPGSRKWGIRSSTSSTRVPCARSPDACASRSAPTNAGHCSRPTCSMSCARIRIAPAAAASWRIGARRPAARSTSSGAAPRAVGIEVKAASRWRRGDGAALAQLVADGTLRRAFGVYLGGEALRDGVIDVLPLRAFLRRLDAGQVLAG